MWGMAKVGRPSIYKPEFAKLARDYCLLGATNAQLAKLFETTEQTIDRWIASNEEFRGSVKEGRVEADANVSNSLYRRALGYEQPAVKIFMPAGSLDPVYAPYTEIVAPDTTAAIFWLKNRRPDVWREKTQVEHSGSLTLEQLVAGSMPDEQKPK